MRIRFCSVCGRIWNITVIYEGDKCDKVLLTQGSASFTSYINKNNDLMIPFPSFSESYRAINMLIGNKKTFAVEYELNNDYGGEWMYGKICYWIENQEIGNYQLGTSLRDVLFGLKYILYDSGNRTDTYLCQTLPEDLFYQLNELIYRVEEDNFNHSLEAPARFEVSINVDVFDGWKIFLIDCIDFLSFYLNQSMMKKLNIPVYKKANLTMLYTNYHVI